MNIELLAESLDSWMKIKTWHTGHSSDNKRFNYALSNVIDKHGCQYSSDEFKDAMVLLFKTHYPNSTLDNFIPKIERYVDRAEKITSYIRDTQ